MGLVLQREPRREAEGRDSAYGVHRLLDAMWDEARAARQAPEREWDVNLSYVLGDQWAERRAPGLSQITNNQLWRIQQQSASLLTDTRPTIEVTSRPNSAAWAQVDRELRKTLEATLFMNDLDRKLVRVVYDLFNCGNAYMKCWYNPLANWQLGEVAIDRIPPRFIWRDPNATTFEDSDYILYRVPVSVWEIKRRYDPVKAAGVVPDATLSQYEESQARHSWSYGPRPRRRRDVKDAAIPKAWVEEWWIKDPELLKTGKPKYPAGRMLTRAGRVVLYDSPNPYWDPWPGPWVDFTVNAMDDTSAYSAPDTTQMRALQDAVNVLVSLIFDNARFITNGIWIQDEGALSDQETRKLRSVPGAVITKARGYDLRRDVGQSLPNQILEVLNMLKQDLMFVSGLLDTGYGKAPKGVTAAAAIESLQFATQAAIRLKIRELESGIVKLGQRVVARIFQHYTTERILDYLGPKDVTPISWDPDVLKLTRDNVVFDDKFDPDAHPPVSEEDRKELLKQFRVRITPGSGLAMSQERKWAKEMALFGAGLTDKEAVLTNIDYPDKEAVLERAQVNEQRQATAGAKAAQGARPRGRGVNITQNLMKS